MRGKGIMGRNQEITKPEFWNGQSIEINVQNKGTYFTQIISHDRMLIVKQPRSKVNIPLLIENGTVVTVYFHDEVIGLCTFTSKIYKHPNEIIFIEKPSDEQIKKVQRRRYFRVNVLADVEIFKQTSNDANQKGVITAYTHDISGGGLAFLTPQKSVEENEVVDGVLHLTLKNKKLEIKFKGKIIRVIQQENNIYKSSLQFLHMTEPVRAELIHYCMMKQIESHKKMKEAQIEKNH